MPHAFAHPNYRCTVCGQWDVPRLIHVSSTVNIDGNTNLQLCDRRLHFCIEGFYNLFDAKGQPTPDELAAEVRAARVTIMDLEDTTAVLYEGGSQRD